VGLLGPHICRMLCGGGHRRLTWSSTLFGGGFLAVCDTIARTLWAPAEIPVGILTSCLGALFFLWLLMRRQAPS
ncbi:MAG TPA: iron ABC transporter permease, partial [Synergistaceae bacterium]|nr:iron ABC transporter permease [Synergistaceae bacterium]